MTSTANTQNTYNIPCPFTGSLDHYATPAEAERAMANTYEEAGAGSYFESILRG